MLRTILPVKSVLYITVEPLQLWSHLLFHTLLLNCIVSSQVEPVKNLIRVTTCDHFKHPHQIDNFYHYCLSYWTPGVDCRLSESSKDLAPGLQNFQHWRLFKSVDLPTLTHILHKFSSPNFECLISFCKSDQYPTLFFYLDLVGNPRNMVKFTIPPKVLGLYKLVHCNLLQWKGWISEIWLWIRKLNNTRKRRKKYL